ncbi:MAG: hypothetical protein GKR89_21235 [Candidatus Latescibacteria bacterium]|nr:hypothetical protein [Candidatus Latescibacterota bacterium]
MRLFAILRQVELLAHDNIAACRQSVRILAGGRAIGLILTFVGLMGLFAGAVQAQNYGARLGTVQRGGKVSFEPRGPGVLFDALDPVVRKWYVPQELYAEYRWKQWDYSNYARDPYQRYVGTSIEGNYFYDAFGNFLTQGWLIYDWREENPQAFGSSLYKDGRFGSWFNQLAIGSDHKGQYHYAITVGNEIRTTLTPMTFSKPKFNGLQLDFAADKYEATALLSRINAPNAEFNTGQRGGDRRTDATNLMAGRVESQVGDFIKVGGTFVSAYQTNTQTGSFGGDMFRGQLSGGQNFSNVNVIEVLITDESPADGEGGGALFASDIIIRDLEGNQIRGSEIGFRAQVEGGFLRQGFLAADGNESILLSFDFGARTYSGPDPGEIDRVTIELVVANDYLIEVASDRQVGINGNVVFMPVARATGNVKDSSNQRVISFDYGLPTANQIVGFTLELTDLAGFKGYAEVDINRRYRQYPNLNLDQHHTASSRSDIWLANLSKVAHPFFFFAEAFDMAPDYTTNMVLLDRDGNPQYANSFQLFEFVEDNDDQDQFPDWFRKGSGELDREIFPGWDENNDFISDFNQNDNEASPNLLPDYEEPFLRFHVDRPEFLYGVDMNHNRWVDRFENDEVADYAYPLNQKGYNVYGGVAIDPDIRLTVGRQRIWQISDDRRNFATYALLTLDKDFPRLGRWRLFQDVRRVKDNIVDDLLQWVQQPDTRGGQRLVRDILVAQDTWINTTWLGFDHSRYSGLNFSHKTKWQFYRQLGSDDDVELRRLRRLGSFVGIIDKIEYQFNIGRITFVPRWKSEFRREVPAERDLPERRELSQLLMFMLRQPLMRSSFLEGGFEYHHFAQLRQPTPPGAEDSFDGLVVAAQLTNLSDYQGYRLTTILGFEVERRSFEVARTQTSTRGFVTIYAGIEQ